MWECAYNNSKKNASIVSKYNSSPFCRFVINILESKPFLHFVRNAGLIDYKADCFLFSLCHLTEITKPDGQKEHAYALIRNGWERDELFNQSEFNPTKDNSHLFKCDFMNDMAKVYGLGSIGYMCHNYHDIVTHNFIVEFIDVVSKEHHSIQ